MREKKDKYGYLIIEKWSHVIDRRQRKNFYPHL